MIWQVAIGLFLGVLGLKFLANVSEKIGNWDSNEVLKNVLIFLLALVMGGSLFIYVLKQIH